MSQLFGLSFLGWSLYGLLSTAQAFVYMAARSDARPLFNVAGTTFAMMWFWALLTPWIYLISVKFPLRRGQLRRSMPVHVGLVLTIPLLDAGVRQLVYPIFGFSLAPVLAAYLRFFDVSFYAYVAIAASAHVFESSRRLQEEALAKSQLEAQLIRAELTALKMQIQPHFLFNTLHGLAEIVHEDADRADQMLTRLGTLLRMTMEMSGVELVPLRTELDLLESYLSIQQIRFGDRLTVEVDVAAETLDVRVPTFILQPLVENALVHGLANGRTRGRIVLRGQAADSVLRLEVLDSGRGLRGPVVERRGVANTRARLVHHFGARQRFSLEAAPGGVGTRASLEIPLVNEDVRTLPG